MAQKLSRPVVQKLRTLCLALPRDERDRFIGTSEFPRRRAEVRPYVRHAPNARTRTHEPESRIPNPESRTPNPGSRTQGSNVMVPILVRALAAFEWFLRFVYPVPDCSDNPDYDEHNETDDQRQRHAAAPRARTRCR